MSESHWRLCAPPPSLCLDENPVELFCITGRQQARANRFAPDEPRDPAQGFPVGTRLRLRTGEQKKQPDRLPIDGFIRHRRPRRAGNRYEIGEGWGLSVWNRDTVANASRELPLSLHDRLEDVGSGPVASDQELDQFPQHALLTLGPNGDPDPVGRQQFGEPQWSMSKCRNRLKIVDLS